MHDSPALKLHANSFVGTLELVICLMIGDDEDLCQQRENLKILGDASDKLGAKHATYGVLQAHYGIVEMAFLRTLHDALLPHMWTAEAKRGRAAVIRFFSRGMKAREHAR